MTTDLGPPFRRMRSASFRTSQERRIREAHIAPVNDLVDQLRRAGRDKFVPYVSADYGGTDSEVLFLFSDPGPGTNADHSSTGSGFLCNNNDDPSAELFSSCLTEVGLDVRRTITWNAYPWFIPGQSQPTKKQLKDGIAPLNELLKLLPRVRVVVACGGTAQASWQLYETTYPVRAGRYVVIQSLHTSGRGITRGSRQTKAEGIAEVEAAMTRALAIVDGTA